MGYEGRSYLVGLGLKKINKIFRKLREPFETDEKSNIIDYNWHVDGILKNSQSYNKGSELVEAVILPRRRRSQSREKKHRKSNHSGGARKSEASSVRKQGASEAVSRASGKRRQTDEQKEVTPARNSNENDSTHINTP